MLLWWLPEYSVNELKPENVSCDSSGKLLLQCNETDWNRDCKDACSNSAYWVLPCVSSLCLMRVQLNLLRFRVKSSMRRNVFSCRLFSVLRGQTLRMEVRCPKQRFSNTVCALSPLADRPGICHFVRACFTGSPCWTPLLYVPMCRACIYLCEARFLVLLSLWTASLLFCSVFQPAVSKKSLWGFPLGAVNGLYIKAETLRK